MERARNRERRCIDVASIMRFDKLLTLIRKMRIDQAKRGVETTDLERKVDEQITEYLKQGMFEI